MLEVKICTKCKESKFLNDYPKGHNQCYICKKEYQAAKRLAKGIKPKIKPLIIEDKKECMECKQIKDCSEFGNSSRGIFGKSSYCKKCEVIFTKIYELKNPEYKEKRKVYNKKYIDKNKENYLIKHRERDSRRRANKLETAIEGDITLEFITNLYATSVCYYCKLEIKVENRTMEHKLPLNRKGPHTKDNLVMACGHCNSSKGDKTEEEFKLYREKLNEYKRNSES